MNDSYLGDKNKKDLQIKSLSQKVYIIRAKTSISRFWTSISSMRSIVYHHYGVLIHAKSVMICKKERNKSLFLMISTTLRAVMIYHLFMGANFKTMGAFSTRVCTHFSSTNWNLSNTDDLSYFLSIIVAVVYGKFAVIQFWQNL